MSQNETRTRSNITNVNDIRQTRTGNIYGQTKSTLVDSSIQSFQYRRNSFNSDNDDLIENQYKLKQTKKYTTPRSIGENTPSTSELDNTNDDDGDDENQSGLLNENARRLLVLGTIRPSKTFYKNLPEADVDHLMEYFRRMKNTQQRMTSEEINQELATKFLEYKPKICKFQKRNFVKINIRLLFSRISFIKL
jgi:hypothetical protein